MRVLALTRYNSQGPSSRVRFYQYIPYLESLGIDLQVSPLLGDEYIRNLFSGKQQSVSSLLLAYGKRVASLLYHRSFDLLWIEKELLPWLPAWVETLWAGREIPWVVDYDDAVIHRYDMNANPLVRTFMGNKFELIMHQATTTVVGNDYLAEQARLAGAGRIEYLPSVVDTTRYLLREGTGAQFRIGWIGTPITAPYLGMIREALEEVIKKLGARLVLVGSGDQDPLPGLEKNIIAWNEENEADIIQSFDVGIMPLPDGPFERGKCGYKLLQYMACGIPVIASPVGANTRIVEQGKTGFLASSMEEWKQALLILSRDGNLRNKLGKAGRKKAEQEYSLQVTAPRLFEILTEARSRKS
jgi:glycosyltransferase involved in cell wall biosynthesis